MSGPPDRESPSRDRFLRAATGKRTDRPPVWMMRQAGRYLPEYRELRAEHTFHEAISTPELAIEISLQPWERFRPDGVVMFSDILPALELLGFSYRLESGVGPIVENPVSAPTDVVDRPRRDPAVHLDHVGRIIGGLRDRLGDRSAVIGFVGGPFTLAAYAAEGEPSRTFMAVRRLRWAHPDAFAALLEQLGDVLVSYARFQADAGADVIQLFDTYAGLLPTADLRKFVVPIHRRIVRAVDVPTIVFARHMGGRLDILDESGADVISVDWTVDMARAQSILGERPVQGNLDPAALFAPPDEVAARTEEIIRAAGDVGHILNLGHGVHKETPIAGVRAFFETAQGWEP